MRSTSVGTREDVRLIARRGRQPSSPGVGGGVGSRVVKSDVMLVSRRRRVRPNDRQSVLAVLQQGSPVNDAKRSMGICPTKQHCERSVA